jgi:hypothetical protein
MGSVNDVSQVRDELEAIALALRREELASESELLAGLNRTFFTTTTEYLVEALDALDAIGSTKRRTSISPNVQRRIDAVAVEARRLANLR